MAFFDNFKQGLTKTRDFLTGGIRRISAAMGYFDEEQLDELEDLLIQSDLGVQTVTRLMDEVRDSIQAHADASTHAVLGHLRSGILEALGPKRTLPIEEGKLNILLLIGVNGTGKTTTCGKLAARFQTEGKRVLLAAADTFRAAAIDQLQHWAELTHTPCIASSEGADPASVVYDAVRAALSRNVDVLIVDTAGRLHNKKNLMDELAKLRRILSREAPNARVESLLVLDANTGQNAVSQAKLFQEPAQLTGLILTKLDGNARGGVAVAVTAESSLPIYLVGLGERVEDLADFDPARFTDALLPAMESLQEKTDSLPAGFKDNPLENSPFDNKPEEEIAEESIEKAEPVQEINSKEFTETAAELEEATEAGRASESTDSKETVQSQKWTKFWRWGKKDE